MFKSRQAKKLHERTIAGTKSHNMLDKETDDLTVSDEDAEAVAECHDYVFKLKETRISEAGAVLEINEPYLPIDDLVFDDAQSTTAGYADKVLLSWDKKKADVTDYKFGRWPVTEAEKNLQGLAYSLGTMFKFRTVDDVWIHFLQPHLKYITVAHVSRLDIPRIYARICTVVARAREARKANRFDNLQPYAPVCGFCDHLGRCESATKMFIEIGHKFSPLEVPADITPTQIYNERDTAMAMKLTTIVSSWATAFRRVITDRVLRGDADEPNGFELTTTQKRQLKDLTAYRKIALKYITKAQWDSTLDTTFGAVEDLVSEAAPRGHKERILNVFKEETLKSGCVELSDPITFLKAKPGKPASR